MRMLVLLPLLLAVPVYGSERTWTIARDVYRAKAELVAIRGNSAYLRIDGKVEEIPIERLSADDQDYLASLSLAPISPAPAATDLPGPAAADEIGQEEMPLPGKPDAPASARTPGEPELAPAYGGMRVDDPPQSRTTYRVGADGRLIGPRVGATGVYLAPNSNSGTARTNDPRYRRSSSQSPSNRNTNSRRDDDNDRRGLFGGRARRRSR
jgi:hypothetical protein